MVIKGREKVGIENLKDPKTFVDYSQTNDDVYENLKDYNPTKKRRVLIVFDNMIADMQSNRKLSTKVTELFLRGRKIKISLVFISQSYFKVPKTIRLNATQYLIMKIPNERELQQRASNYSSDIDFKNSMKIYKENTEEPCLFLVNNRTVSTDNPLRFRKNLL